MTLLGVGARHSRWVTVLVAAALSVGLPSVAFAHNVVDSRDPAADSVVTESPVTISISTNDEFLDTGGVSRGFALVAQDAAGLYYGDGCVTITERTMSATIDLGGPGVYSVLYQFISADGHTLQESYEFVFEPAPSHVPATGLTDPPVCGEVAEEPAASEDTPELIAPAPVDATPVGANESVSLIPTVAGVFVLVIVLIGLGVSGLRKRRGRN